MSTLLQDLKYGFRILMKNPGFTAVAVLSLALGIGANSAVFSVVDGAFLRPLPVEDPDRLVVVFTGSEKEPEGDTSYPDYLDVRDQSTVFMGVLAHGGRGAFVSAKGQGEMVSIDVVSDNFFSVLGVTPALGRAFLPPTDLGSEESGVVISHALWQRLFGGDPTLVGKPIQIDGKSIMLLGIAPADFHGLDKLGTTDVWATPRGWCTLVEEPEFGEFRGRGGRWFQLVARVRPGVNPEQVRAQLQTLSSRLAQAYPVTNKDKRFGIATPADELRALRPPLLLMSAVGLVLLIACANVAGLLLAQNERRRREIAMRLALGAGPWRLARQLLAESALLAPVGGLLGLGLAWWLIDLVPALMPPSPESLGPDVRLDGRVLAFTIVATLATSLIFGLVPALHASKGDLVPVLKGEASNVGKGLGGLPLRKLLVVGEVALSVTLLAGAALLLRSLARTLAINPGFDPNKNVVMLNMAPPFLYGYNDNQATALYESLMERLRTLPGVKRASYARRPLLVDDEGGETQEVTFPGVPLREGEHGVSIRYNIVSLDYLPTMGTHLVRGRGFELQDGPSSPKVVLINQTMARRFWPRRDPVGQWLRIGKEQYQVVGVVEDGKYLTIHESSQPYLFFPFAQMFSGEASLFVETEGDSRGVIDTIMREARSVNEKVPIVGSMTLKQHMQYALYVDRMAAGLMGSLALLGIFLAAVGLYGVISYAVSRRIHEIGIRMALGARRADVARLVLRQSLGLVLGGVFVGVGMALAVTRLMSGILWGVKPTDPVALASGVLFAVAVSLVASYIPARRATRVDPMVALRYE
ncbi:MAG TPA: ABC transporter permease [Terriglobia bacterium]|nr:ABC transporter permease [Terriglobia bacterium]